MSKQLLHALNGGQNGIFSKWLNAFEGEPNISWHPSAGDNYRNLLYFSDRFNAYSARKEMPPTPDIFLHNDVLTDWERERHSPQSKVCGRWLYSHYLNRGEVIYADYGTEITILDFEKLPPLHLPVHPAIYSFSNDLYSHAPVIYMELEIKSDKLGRFVQRMLYASVENTALIAEVVWPNMGKLSSIYMSPWGMGENRIGSGWIGGLLSQFGTQFVATDNTGLHQCDDGRSSFGRVDPTVGKIYPEIYKPNNIRYLQFLPQDGKAYFGLYRVLNSN